MWAGGEINFVVRSPRLGERVRQTVSLPTNPVLKHGKNGPLVFVSRKHDIYSLDEQKLLMSDTTNFVYKLREKRSVPQSDSTAATSSAPPSSSASVVYRREHIDLNEILLFRYSAMTWNSHKIHYEKAFAQSDGYADILVHGPLTATLLLDHLGKVSEVLAGREPAAFKQQQAEKAAAVAAASHSAQKHAHSHSHSHGGVPCTGHHATPPDETPYHMKYE